MIGTDESLQAKPPRIVIVGGGTAGISTAAAIRRRNKNLKIVVIEPSEVHYYQPLWTLVGAGEFKVEDSARAEKQLIPPGVEWCQDAVEAFEPAQNEVITRQGKHISYSVLIVCLGLQIDWSAIKGLSDAIEQTPVSSNYSPHLVSKTEMASDRRAGIF